MKRFGMAIAAAAAAAWLGSTWVQAQGGTVDKMYVLDCGVGHSTNMGHWTNGIGEGKPIDISVSCYLIHHSQKGWVLFETGITDLVAGMPNGWQAGGNAQGIRWTLAKTLAAQLAELKLSPAEIHNVVVSHMHPDSFGNVELFKEATVWIQRLEYEQAFPPVAEPPQLQAPPQQGMPSFLPDHPVRLLQGDSDVFSDGSFMLFATPGHTLGHMSAMVRLPKTGAVILTADAVHLQQNWDNRRIPYFTRNMMGEGNVAGVKMWLSMQRLADLQAFYKAQLWILHDVEQTKTLRHSPAYYE